MAMAVDGRQRPQQRAPGVGQRVAGTDSDIGGDSDNGGDGDDSGDSG